MELAQLIDALMEPAAYPYSVTGIEVRHTHISVVFLAGPYVYKIKKPVAPGFLDFSTLERRHHFCLEEVRLNRRLAPAVYLGVVPVTQTAGAIRLEGDGTVIEWAVKMQRLAEEASLQQHLLRGTLRPEWMHTLARKIAAFHRRAETGEPIAAFGRFPVVARNARENLEQAAPLVGITLSRPVLERLTALTETALARSQPLIDERANRGLIRDTHGDLRLDHVYLVADQEPPELFIIDCIEFNERFRFADPVADSAFLVMDLLFHGARELARLFTEAYFEAAGDAQGRTLLPFYTAYRAAVRAKVEGLEWLEKEVPEDERARALARARAHWLLSLGELEDPARRPCLVLVGGLPGAGKSTLAHALAERAAFAVIRSDVVRKELAGRVPPAAPATIYTSEWNERTYSECLRRAEALLFEGQRVLVDASFREEKRRRAFLETARKWAVPTLLLLCQAEPEVVRARLQDRRDDVSDADWAVYMQTSAAWEDPGPFTQPFLRYVPTGESREAALAAALQAISALV